MFRIDEGLRPLLTSSSISIGLVNPSPPIGAKVAEIVSSVKNCRLVAIADAAEAADLVECDRSLALLIVHVADSAGHEAAGILLRSAATRRPAVPVVVVIESALEAMTSELLQWGAADCLVRPLNLSRLSFLIDFLTLHGRSAVAARAPAPARREACGQNKSAAGGLVFASEAAQQLQRTVTRLAAVETTVLLHGETGAGKTCAARLIHELSPRRDRPFVVVNCGSIPESLLEGELFGFRQGAYTGAERNHRGKFAQAEDGTIFLDEIDSLPLAAQSSLLRVVEDRAFEALGSDRTEQVRARLLFATNRNLDAEVQAGRFRQDLYYRLNVVSLRVPGLRERVSEIPALVETYLRELHRRQATQVRRFSSQALEALAGYQWPGNMRQLRNIVEQIAVLCDHEIAMLDDLPLDIRGAISAEPPSALPQSPQPKTIPSRGSQLAGARRSAEREVIEKTLQQCRQNRSRAAESLGISRAAFYKKMRQLGIA